MNSLTLKSFCLTLVILVVALVTWEALLKPPPEAAPDPNLTEEELLMQSMMAFVNTLIGILNKHDPDEVVVVNLNSKTAKPFG